MFQDKLLKKKSALDKSQFILPKKKKTKES